MYRFSCVEKEEMVRGLLQNRKSGENPDQAFAGDKCTASKGKRVRESRTPKKLAFQFHYGFCYVAASLLKRLLGIFAGDACLFHDHAYVLIPCLPLG